MQTEKILRAGVFGTSAMTLFSYLVSESEGKNFKEPEVLSELMTRLFPKAEKSLTLPAGWALHYAMGFTFSAAYRFLWKNSGLKPTVKTGLIFGALSGLIGVSVWKTVFKFHPNPPKIHIKDYYRHLIMAHLIFGAFAALGDAATKDNRN